MERKDIDTVYMADTIAASIETPEASRGRAALVLRNGKGNFLCFVRLDDIYDEDGNRFEY